MEAARPADVPGPFLLAEPGRLGRRRKAEGKEGPGDRRQAGAVHRCVACLHDVLLGCVCVIRVPLTTTDSPGGRDQPFTLTLPEKLPQ